MAPAPMRKRNAASLKKWTRLLANAIEEEKFYQYLFFTQWQALKAYANEKGISIMGDTPIFMAYDSADVWANQKLFQLDSMGFPTVVAGYRPIISVPKVSFGATLSMTGKPTRKQVTSGGQNASTRHWKMWTICASTTSGLLKAIGK